jgi:hypothetical protein
LSEKKGKGKVDLCDDNDEIASSGSGRGEDVWTKEEEDQEEYGHKRQLLKQYGVQKRHVENMEMVKHNYPGLELIMDYLNTTKCTDEQVAEAIRGVPFWDPKGLMEKESNRVWLREQILCLPESIPRDCQYTELEKEAATLNVHIRR